MKAREGFVSVNVDAAFDLNTGSGSTGVVIRDDKGNFLASSNNPVEFAIDAATTEALAIRHGLYLANQLGANKLPIQSDCLEMIEILNDGGFTAMAATPIIEDICMQATTFTSIDFIFCPRNANSVAHMLAKECESQPNVWVEDPPIFVIPLLINDVSAI